MAHAVLTPEMVEAVLPHCAECNRWAELLFPYKHGEKPICGKCANVRFNKEMRSRANA